MLITCFSSPNNKTLVAFWPHQVYLCLSFVDPPVPTKIEGAAYLTEIPHLILQAARRHTPRLGQKIARRNTTRHPGDAPAQNTERQPYTQKGHKTETHEY